MREDLETRVRRSLQARAEDVTITPELWERVARATNRRRSALVVGWALAGAAAVAAVLVGLALRPEQVTISDPAAPPTAAASPSETASASAPPATTGDLAPVVVYAREQSLVVDDGHGTTTVVAIEPGEPWRLIDVAVRPGARADDLLVGVTFAVEGDVEVAVLHLQDGAWTQTWRLGALGSDGSAGPAQLEWSDDGAFLAWTRACGPTQLCPGTAALQVASWAQVLAAADPAGVVATSAIDGLDGLVPTLADWAGRPADGGTSTIYLTADYVMYLLEVETTVAGACESGGQRIDDPTCLGIAATGPAVRHDLEAGAVVDVTDAGSHLYVLVARSEQTGDAEGAVLHLVQDPDGDTARDILLPADLTAPTADPGSAWLASDAAGPLVLGRGEQAWALFLPDEAPADERGPIQPGVTGPVTGVVVAGLGHPGAVVAEASSR